MVKDNNPGNIRPGQNYEGEGQPDNGFSTFNTMALGIRAWLMNFYEAVYKHNRTNLTDYITAYAPPSENNTAAYISGMVGKTGIPADYTMPLDTDTVMLICKSQFEIEDG